MESPSERSRIVTFARESLGRKRIENGGQKFQDDCTGLVMAAYSEVGIRLFSHAKDGDNGVSAIYRYVKSKGRVFRSEAPSPGDLVFFRETYDVNRDGRANDGLTHVGIVEAVDNGSTVTIIHRVNRGVVRYRMNLDRPGMHRDTSTGDVLNDYLRPPGQNQQLTLTGQLFAGYGSLLAPEPRRVAKSAP
jgi:cell wall-associated NlpC family hydrolase